MCAVPNAREVNQWFLHRGLPLVLTRRVRSRALIERSAPVVSGVGAIISLTMMLAELTGGDPDYGYVIRLGVLTLLLMAAPVALYRLHQAGQGGQALSCPSGDGALRVRASVRRQRFFRFRRRRDLRVRARRAAGGVADLPRLRCHRVVGVPVRAGTGWRARHADEPCAATPDADRRGVLHRRAVAVGCPDDPAKAMADSRIPCCCGNRLH